VPKSPKYLLIGSAEPYSGKTATILGIAHQLQQKKLDIAYGKPLGTCENVSHPADGIDEDVRLVAKTLNLPKSRLLPTLVFLDEGALAKRLQGEDGTDYSQALAKSVRGASGDLVLLEGAGTLEEGYLLNLSLPQVAEAVDASVLLVTGLQSVLSVDLLLAAKQRLGARLSGVLLNDIPAELLFTAEEAVRPFLESRGVPVLGMLPRSNLLRSVSVAELARRLNAEVLCRSDRLDLMVETLTIGAMNVNSAIKYFSQGRNMAVVTGGDRTDIQMAALETNTQCLILTGHIQPSPAVLSRAEEVEVPVLSVALDTLATVEIIERALGQVRLQEPVKVEYIVQMMAEHFDIDRLLAGLGLQPAVARA
jgi:BioD-like phosphotransacetylase family protein